MVLDVDATLVTAHSEKEQAAATFKRGFGYHPLGVWCDNTQEMLAVKLRAGNAGSNTATDHIEVLGAAINQVPAAHRKKLLIRADGAGASHDLLDWLTTRTRSGAAVWSTRWVRGHREGPGRDRPGAGAGMDPRDRRCRGRP